MDLVPCPHYQRHCQLLMNCCNRPFGCLQCHNLQSDHEATKDNAKALICLKCGLQQSIQSHCLSCQTSFGKYFCLDCKIFDDAEKGQFHCSDCGLCRLGGSSNFFHCKKCAMCLPISLKNDHTCVENVSRCACPVCQEDLHTSKEPCQIPPCHHLIHKSCFDQLIQNCHFYCPTCSKSLLNLQPLWEAMKVQIDQFPMQGKMKDVIVNIICRDCTKPCQTIYHVIGLQCLNCLGFNTIRSDGKLYTKVNDELTEMI